MPPQLCEFTIPPVSNNNNNNNNHDASCTATNRRDVLTAASHLLRAPFQQATSVLQAQNAYNRKKLALLVLLSGLLCPLEASLYHLCMPFIVAFAEPVSFGPRHCPGLSNTT